MIKWLFRPRKEGKKNIPSIPLVVVDQNSKSFDGEQQVDISVHSFDKGYEAVPSDSLITESKPSIASLALNSGGISLLYLKQVVTKMKLANSIEFQMWVQQETNGSGSFYELLAKDASTVQFVKPLADAFVSYAWSNSLLDIIDGVLTAKQGDDLFVWMDIVMVDQNNTNAGTVDFDHLSHCFYQNLKAINLAIIVLCELEETPIPATRSWCVFEWYTIVSLKIPFQTVVPPDVATKFDNAVCLQGKYFDEFALLFSKIDVTRAQAREAADQAAIQQLIREIGPYKVSDVAIVKVKAILFERLKSLTTNNTLPLEALINVWKTLGSVELFLGMFDDAIASNETVMQLVLQEHGQMHKATGDAHLAMAWAWWTKDNGHVEERLQACEVAKVIFETLGETNEVRLGFLHLNLCGAYIDKGDYTLGQEFLDSAKEHYFNSLSAPALETLSRLAQNQARIFSSTLKYELALEYYQEANTILFQLTGGSEHTVAAITYCNMGYIATALDQHDRAAQLFALAEEILIRTVGPNHTDLSYVFSGLGNLYLNKCQYQEALQVLNKALALELKKDSPRGAARVSQSLLSVYAKLKDQQGIEKYGRISLEWYKEEFAASPSYKILWKVAIVCSDMGDHENSILYFKEAMPFIGNDPVLTAMFHSNIALEYKALGLKTNAELHYQAAMDIFITNNMPNEANWMQDKINGL